MQQAIEIAKFMARPTRFERVTSTFGGWHAIQSRDNAFHNRKNRMLRALQRDRGLRDLTNLRHRAKALTPPY
jgi:hypothetical protein